MEFTARSVLLSCTTVAAGINSGGFFVFSNFVMASLGRLGAAEGARAMQVINRGAPNPLFLATLLGGGVAGTVLAATAAGDPCANWQVACVTPRWRSRGGVVEVACDEGGLRRRLLRCPAHPERRWPLRRARA